MKPPFRYEKLGYAALNVTNLDKSVHFYKELMGLDLVSREDGVAYLRCSRDHHNLVLYTSATPGLRRAAYKMASAEDLKLAFDFYTAHKLAPKWLSDAECKALNQGPTFRVGESASRSSGWSRSSACSSRNSLSYSASGKVGRSST